jgi:hypothetical protein
LRIGFAGQKVGLNPSEHQRGAIAGAVKKTACPSLPALASDDGSMSELGFRGDKTKVQEAREAASLFIDLLRTDRTHQAGLATFSSTSSLDFALAPISPANKDTLIGPAPARNAGVIGSITPGGSTTIGGWPTTRPERTTSTRRLR